MGKGHCVSITIIAISSFVLLMTVFMTFGGFGLVLRLGLPIGLSLLPVNEELTAWITIPLSITARAKIISVNALSAENGTVGGGEMSLELALGQWEDVEYDYDEDPVKLVEFIHIEETSELDEIQYYTVTLSESIENNWNFFSWVLVLIGVFGIGAGTAWRILARPPSKLLDEK